MLRSAISSLRILLALESATEAGSSHSINDVTNDTSESWIGFDVEVKLDTTTLLSSCSLSSGNVTDPTDWTTASTVNFGPPTALAGGGYEYLGFLDFVGGAEIVPNDDIEYGYTVSFNPNPAQWQIHEVDTPVPVPEPGTSALLAAGFLAVWWGSKRIPFTRRRRSGSSLKS